MKILEFVFKSEQHKIRTMRFNYANQDLTEANAKSLMERIAALEMFQKDGVKQYVTPVGHIIWIIVTTPFLMIVRRIIKLLRI